MTYCAVKIQILLYLMIILNHKYSFATGTDKSNYSCASLENTFDSTNCILSDDYHHLECIGNYYYYHHHHHHHHQNKYPNESSSKLIESYQYSSIWSLTICDGSQLYIYPRDMIHKFPNLKTLTIINGNLTTIATSFPSVAKLEKICIIGTQLHSLPNNVFKYLPVLHTINLRNNALTEINPGEFNNTALHSIYLDGNPWKCNYNMSWILNMNNNSLAEKIEDREQLHCSIPYEGRPLVSVVEIIANLKDECDRTVCDCELMYVGIIRNASRQTNKRQLMAFVTVNCSYRGFEEMPEFVPANTTRLYLIGNRISHLTAIVSNPIYREVRDLYLDNNLIESIAELEGSYWLDNFRIFSLRGNQLTSLPTYALENVLLQSGNAVSIYLGNNPWTCDCLFTPGFQELLIRYTNLIKDIHDIKCHSLTNNNDKNSGKIIKDLTRTEICIMPNDKVFFLYPLDFLNIILGALIIFIISKLLYDYWLFKRTGKLPWIVTKIP